jgi:hypothetical protein
LRGVIRDIRVFLHDAESVEELTMSLSNAKLVERHNTPSDLRGTSIELYEVVVGGLALVFQRRRGEVRSGSTTCHEHERDEGF